MRMLAPISNVPPAEYEKMYYDEFNRSCRFVCPVKLNQYMESPANPGRFTDEFLSGEWTTCGGQANGVFFPSTAVGQTQRKDQRC